MSLYPVSARVVGLAMSRSRQIRFAHVASAHREDGSTSGGPNGQSYIPPDTSNGPSRSSASTAADALNAQASSSRRTMGQDPKGKGKAKDPLTETYRFPTRGKNGGLPGPYEVLGLDKSASSAEIKSQYYRLALILHPDASHPSSSPSNFATLNRAYKLLSSSSSRQTYLNSNYGWSPDGNSRPEDFDPMWAEVMRRKRDGAGMRSGGMSSRGRGDAGRGAWGAYGMDGKWYDFPEAGVGGAPRYMGHGSFAALILFLGGILTWIQYHRLDTIVEYRRESLDAAHLSASHALAQAREEARIYGPARLEAIRRRVDEQKIAREAQLTERNKPAGLIAAPPNEHE